MKYYSVKPKDKPSMQGTLVGKLGNEMSVIIEGSIEELGLHFDDKGNIVSSKDFTVQQITCVDKEKYMHGYEEWEGMQALTSVSAGPLPSLSGKTFPNGIY